jgi:hypothetical protein
MHSSTAEGGMAHSCGWERTTGWGFTSIIPPLVLFRHFCPWTLLRSQQLSFFSGTSAEVTTLVLLIGDQGNLLAKVTADSQVAFSPVTPPPTTPTQIRLGGSNLACWGSTLANPNAGKFMDGPRRGQISRAEKGPSSFLLLRVLEFS